MYGIVLGWALLATVVALGSLAALDTANDRADLLATQLEAAQKRITTVQSQVQKSTTRSQQARQTVKEKLDEVPTFRDTAVPEPVRDSLCQHLRCK